MRFYSLVRYSKQVNMISQYLKRRDVHHRVLTGSTPEKRKGEFFESSGAITKILVTTTVLDDRGMCPMPISIIMGGMGSAQTDDSEDR